jgi:sugar phosphate isomerase/epimerase
VKFGICGEIFQDWDDSARTIDFVKETGYDGLEIAPFTLAQTVTDIPAKKASPSSCATFAMGC